MQVLSPDSQTRATFELESGRPMSDEEFFDLCTANPGLRIERDAQGEIIIMPPAGFETGFRNNDLCRQLGNWAKVDGRGVALDSNTEYILPNGAARSPDASWVRKSRLEAFTREQKRKFLPLCPDFVVELLSPTDGLTIVKSKIVEWTANGAELGWLIDPDRSTVTIYRPSHPPTVHSNLDEIAGESPIDGFRLDLRDIWAGV